MLPIKSVRCNFLVESTTKEIRERTERTSAYLKVYNLNILGSFSWTEKVQKIETVSNSDNKIIRNNGFPGSKIRSSTECNNDNNCNGNTTLKNTILLFKRLDKWNDRWKYIFTNLTNKGQSRVKVQGQKCMQIKAILLFDDCLKAAVKRDKAAAC